MLDSTEGRGYVCLCICITLLIFQGWIAGKNKSDLPHYVLFYFLLLSSRFFNLKNIYHIAVINKKKESSYYCFICRC
jgi:hypothetical protein